MQSWGIGRIWTHEALSTSFTAKQIWPLSYNTVSRIIFAILLFAITSHFCYFAICYFAFYVFNVHVPSTNYLLFAIIVDIFKGMFIRDRWNQRIVVLQDPKDCFVELAGHRLNLFSVPQLASYTAEQFLPFDVFYH